MSSSVQPINAARVTMLMKTDMLLNSIQRNSAELLQVQNQLTSGLKLGRPSDSPAEATTIMHLDSMLEGQQQFLNNISYATDYLASTENALTQAVELVRQAYDLALDSIGTGGESGRESNAVIVDQIIAQLVNIANYTCRGSYVFGGKSSDTAPFEAVAGGVSFVGSLGELQTAVAPQSGVTFNLSAAETFGALSGEVVGSADLNPDITSDTLLSDLNGYMGQGIRRGSIIVSDGTGTATIDLSNAVTVGDVVDMINSQTATTGVTAQIDAVTGYGLSLSAAVGSNITVKEVGTGHTAGDLGIYEPVGAGVLLTGQDVDARLTLVTPIAALAGGAGIDTANGLVITNSLLSPSTVQVDLSGASRLGDILNAINNAGIGARAEINSAGTGINVLNQMSGSEMTIGENGGTSATDLGIRSMTGATSLSDLNGGLGVHVEQGADDIQIWVDGAAAFAVNLDSAGTVQDVIDLVNAAATGAGYANIQASLADVGNGIVITDTGAAAASIAVTTINLSDYFTARELGLEQGDNSTGVALAGADVNPVKPDGVFSHLIALRDAMLSSDADASAAISAAADALEQDQTILADALGRVGAQMRALETRQMQTEDKPRPSQSTRICTPPCRPTS